MRLAVVTPARPTSARLERAHAAIASLAERVEVEVFVETRAGGAPISGSLSSLPVSALDERSWDQVLYTVEDEASCGFVLPWVRRLGGTVSLGSWSLPALARAALPAIARGGLAGLAAAWREGGWADARPRRAPAGGRALVLNRSIVRFADAFLVEGEDLAQRIRSDRNAPTPIGVVADAAGAAELATGWLWHLERFPAPRSRTRSLVRTLIEAADRRRLEGASRTDGAEPEGPSSRAL